MGVPESPSAGTYVVVVTTVGLPLMTEVYVDVTGFEDLDEFFEVVIVGPVEC